MFEQLKDNARIVAPTQRIDSRVEPGIRYTGWPDMLERALDNLLRNALRFNPEGVPVELRAQHDGQDLVISVRDHGPGVADEHLPQLSEPFFRAPGQTAAGHGLGWPSPDAPPSATAASCNWPITPTAASSPACGCRWPARRTEPQTIRRLTERSNAGRSPWLQNRRAAHAPFRRTHIEKAQQALLLGQPEALEHPRIVGKLPGAPHRSDALGMRREQQPMSRAAGSQQLLALGHLRMRLHAGDHQYQHRCAQWHVACLLQRLLGGTGIPLTQGRGEQLAKLVAGVAFDDEEAPRV